MVGGRGVGMLSYSVGAGIVLYRYFFWVVARHDGL